MEDGERWRLSFAYRYFRYIHSPEWAEKRNQRLEMDDHTCQTCCGPGEEVHHKHYKTFGSEDVQSDLITLCKPCHKAITSELRRRRHLVRQIGTRDVERTTPVGRKGENQNGISNVEVQNQRRSTPNYEQWTKGGPTEQIFKNDKASIL